MTENNPISLGEILRIKREESKIEISEISSHLRVKQSDIKAIEENRIGSITNHIYAPGLIRSYAKFLRIDEKFIEEQLGFLKFKSNIENKAHTLLNLDEEDNLHPSKNISFHALTLAIIIFLLLFPIYNRLANKSDLITNSDLISQLNNVFSDGR
ncbi:MAG: helix-turn-helix domain-containing protein [Proteobacteria bacterium]|nr:helix-turn-helix domain-containing protein [Pseudomonadota bacterium]